MPAQEIPGYYFDEEKNRYFKVMPTGPHSLAAIKARKAAKEEQKPQQPSKKRKVSPTSIRTFCQWRETQSQLQTPTCLMSRGSRFLFRNLAVDTEIQLCNRSSALAECHSTCMDFTSFPDNGEAVVSFAGGRLIRYGYQCDPFFQLWRTGFEWNLRSDITSLQFGQSTSTQKTVIGTSLGQGGLSPAQIWRYSYPALPAISTDDADGLSNQLSASSRRGPRRGFVSTDVCWTAGPQILQDYNYNRTKDTFWSSSVDDAHNTIVLGSEKGVTHLTSDLNCVNLTRTKSAVFATKLLESQPRISWIGCRNGDVQLFDTRTRRSTPMFRQSSAITHLMPFERVSSGNQVLAAGMDGSLCLWDARVPSFVRPNHESRPLRKLYGHVNNHHRQIAFDVEPTMNLVAAAGSDHRLRIWSLSKPGDNEPFWISEKFGDGPVPAAKFMTSPPQIQDAWSRRNRNPPEYSYRRSPGIFVCAPSVDGFPAIQWLAISL
ncbi:hypothetical protein DFQ28_004609 [Apophysomyces sp. BC1034]|nr:hypothetical protein DFQ30_004522 [Apophysomyces sp. BC1015]KAG0180966.1 hypothetical protein DFQ29_009716 [Apophysomyces sp. BC1021]KAG0188603.1 hypothetical protein DFQ28_004609 [Apophysomyces sp. BC1034]